MDLFSEEKTHLKLPNAELIYIPNFYDSKKSDILFDQIKSETPWQHDSIKLFGKTIPQPRLTALYASNDIPYRYSNITMYPHPMTTALQKVKSDIEKFAEIEFSTVLINLYRDGNDSNGWHADNEKSLGVNPIIASFSLGATRSLHFKHRNIKEEKYKLPLTHGSLLLMKGEMQHHWLHQIPKMKNQIKERINLTFRVL